MLCPLKTQGSANHAMQCNITEGQNVYQFIMLAKSLHCTYVVLYSLIFIFFRFSFFINVYMVLLLFNGVIYVFLLLRLCILIVCLCMATLTEVFCVFSSVVRQMPG
jgi:hypothetical protein